MGTPENTPGQLSCSPFSSVLKLWNNNTSTPALCSPCLNSSRFGAEISCHTHTPGCGKLTHPPLPLCSSCSEEAGPGQRRGEPPAHPAVGRQARPGLHQEQPELFQQRPGDSCVWGLLCVRSGHLPRAHWERPQAQLCHWDHHQGHWQLPRAHPAADGHQDPQWERQWLVPAHLPGCCCLPGGGRQADGQREWHQAGGLHQGAQNFLWGLPAVGLWQQLVGDPSRVTRGSSLDFGFVGACWGEISAVFLLFLLLLLLCHHSPAALQSLYLMGRERWSCRLKWNNLPKNQKKKKPSQKRTQKTPQKPHKTTTKNQDNEKNPTKTTKKPQNNKNPTKTTSKKTNQKIPKQTNKEKPKQKTERHTGGKKYVFLKVKLGSSSKLCKLRRNSWYLWVGMLIVNIELGYVTNSTFNVQFPQLKKEKKKNFELSPALPV